MGDATSKRRWSTRLGQCIAPLAVGACLFPTGAKAADPEPLELRQAVRSSLPAPNFAPNRAAGLRLERDTQWTVMTLADPWGVRGWGKDARAPIAGLGRFDLRQTQWQATPYAATTLASAFVAVATRGVPVLREIRDGSTIRSHRLGCYFRGRGGGVMWRIEF